MTNTQRPTKANIVPARFDLIDHDGNHVTNERYAGNYVLMFFGFTHCQMVCPRALAKLSDVLDGLGERAERITALYVTVDPDRDTADIMKAFLTQHYPRFTGLTGSPRPSNPPRSNFGCSPRRTPTPMTLNNMLFRIRRSPTFSGRTESSSRTSPMPPKRPKWRTRLRDCRSGSAFGPLAIWVSLPKPRGTRKLAAARHDLRVQILNVAGLLPTRDWEPQMPNVKRRRQEGADQDLGSKLNSSTRSARAPTEWPRGRTASRSD